VPDWVAEAAADVGVRFVTLSPLDADAVRVQLEDLRPHGYLLTWPELGPFVDEALAEAAGDLRLVTYAGQSTEPAFYTANLDVAALHEVAAQIQRPVDDEPTSQTVTMTVRTTETTTVFYIRSRTAPPHTI
jgi:hypothetical protein